MNSGSWFQGAGGGGAGSREQGAGGRGQWAVFQWAVGSGQSAGISRQSAGGSISVFNSKPFNRLEASLTRHEASEAV